MEEYEQQAIALPEQLDFEDNVYIVTVLESSQRPSGIFSQIEWLGMTSALSLSKRAEGGPLLRRIEQIRLPDIQLNQIVETNSASSPATRSGVGANASSSDNASSSSAYLGAGGLSSFTIHHRVNSVVYGTSDFIVQNRSLLFFNPSMRNIVDAVKSSSHAFVRELAAVAEPASKFKMKNSAELNGPKFLTQQRVNELGHVITRLQRTNMHFVACLNPNQLARPGYIACVARCRLSYSLLTPLIVVFSI